VRERFLACEHTDTVLTTAIIDGGGVGSVHIGQGGKLREHIVTRIASGHTVKLLYGNGLHVGVIYDARDALARERVVQAHAVVDVVTHQVSLDGAFGTRDESQQKSSDYDGESLLHIEIFFVKVPNNGDKT
jgi:hypothetical protein